MGLQVEGGELDLAVNSQYSLSLRSAGPHRHLKSHLYQPLCVVCTWAGGVFTNGRVDVACGFVAARGDVVFLSNAMAVCRTKPALDPLSFDGDLELLDGAVVGLLL